MTTKTDNGAEFLVESAKAQGVACSTVKDGHVLVFTKKKLLELAEAADGHGGMVIVFVKRPDFKD